MFLIKEVTANLGKHKGKKTVTRIRVNGYNRKNKSNYFKETNVMGSCRLDF